MRVSDVRSEEELEAALELRRVVFCDEQAVPRNLERDPLDRGPATVHLVAVDDEEVVGTCRLVFAEDKVRLGRMVVRGDRRGEGIAGLLLALADLRASEKGARRVVLNAQTAAQGVYARAGYVAVGDRFDEAGIEHVRMEKALGA